MADDALSLSPDKAFLHSLEIENIRCFGPKQTLHFTSPHDLTKHARWTVILGENGTGKTTLLQAIALSQTTHSNNILGRSSIFLDTALWNQDQTQNQGHSGKIQITQSNKTNLHTIDKTGGQLSLRIDQLIMFAYGSNRRIRPLNAEPTRDSDPLRGYETLFDEQASLQDPAELLLQAYLTAQLQGEDQPEATACAKARLELLREALSAVLPDIGDVQIKLVNNKPAVLFKTPYGEVRTRQLSAGYRAMAAWVCDLVGRMFEAYPDSEQPLHEPVVVLVDEFDLHMHPRWQRDSVAFLSERFPAAQFIITAHSPLIVQAAPDINLAVLRREGDHVVIDNDPESVAHWRVDQILTSELFGLETARPQATQALIDERRALLSQPTLTDADKARVQELEAALDEMPEEESPAEIRAMQLIKEMSDALAKRQGGARP